jgi:hypothetical protein
LKRAFASAIAIASVIVPTLAGAQAKDPCITAYEQAQTLRKDGKFIDAREQAQLCSRDACPAILVKDCTRWIGELDASTGSVICEAKTTSGKELTDVRVTIDGNVVTSRLDGRPIPVDPGKHRIHFERRGATHDETALVREGEKNRRITATFPDAPVESKGLPTGFWIFGGISIVALGTATFFALDGMAKKDDLEACKPRCSPSEVDSMSASFTVADVALGAGVVAVAATIYLLLSRPNDARDAALSRTVLRF